jgi:branched-chain amino acid transport system substrate-binding protein
MAFLSPSQKHSILISSLIIFGLTGLAIFAFTRPRQNLQGTATGPSSTSSANKTSADADSSGFDLGQFFRLGQQRGIEQRLSLGDKVLVGIDNSPDKQEGVKLFKAGKYPEAIAKFNNSLTLNRNDPETWIYLNNAKATLMPNPLKVAVAVPIGGNVNVAKEILRGVAQYQHEINHGSRIQGRGLQVVIVNDDNNSDVGKQLATQLVKDPSILAVIGHQSSDVSGAVAPIYQASRLVMVSPTSTARSFNSIGNYIFRTTPSSRAVAGALTQYIVKDMRIQKVAICADSKSLASQSFRDDFIAGLYELGGQITRTACDFSAADFNPNDIPSEAIRDGANAILLAPGVEKLNLALEVIQANRGKIPLIGGQSLYTFETLQKGLVDAKGMTLAVPWDPSEAKGSDYAKVAQNLWGGPGSWRTAMAYDATKVIATGLQSGQDRKHLQEVLSEGTFNVKGVTGNVAFLPTGDRNKPGTLMKILPGRKSGTGYDFVSLKTLTSIPTK